MLVTNGGQVNPAVNNTKAWYYTDRRNPLFQALAVV
jgi:hypothetical protein